MKKFCVFVALAAVAGLALAVTPEVNAALLQNGALIATAVIAAGAFGCIGDIQLVKSKELREMRANLVDTNSKLLKRIGEEKDAARVAELEKEWDKRDDDILALDKQIERAERQETLDAEAGKPSRARRSGRQPGGRDGEELSAEEVTEQRERYKRVFWDSMRYGERALSSEDQELLRHGFSNWSGRVIDNGREGRAMSTTVGAGGYTIPQGFFPELQKNMLAFGGVRPLAKIITTGSGAALPIATADDTANEAAIVGEGAALSSPQDPGFGVVTLNAFTYRTLCLVSLELMQDSEFEMETFIRGIIAERIARGTNRHFTVGNGSTQPNGFITGGSSGYTAAASNSVAHADLIELEHSVDPAYRALPGTGWQMHDRTLKVLKKLVDSDNRPLWQAGMSVKEPNMLCGYPYTINQHMATIEASAKSVAFGAWSKYWIRDVSTMLLIRANELHIANGQIGFYAFSRHDGDVMDAGTDPIRYLTHPSP